jgi:hypothetical protein
LNLPSPQLKPWKLSTLVGSLMPCSKRSSIRSSCWACLCAFWSWAEKLGKPRLSVISSGGEPSSTQVATTTSRPSKSRPKRSSGRVAAYRTSGLGNSSPALTTPRCVSRSQTAASSRLTALTISTATGGSNRIRRSTTRKETFVRSSIR